MSHTVVLDFNVDLYKWFQGHYGEVFKGVLEREEYPPQQVAVKQLKSDCMDPGKGLDLKREIAIMQVSILNFFHQPFAVH